MLVIIYADADGFYTKDIELINKDKIINFSGLKSLNEYLSLLDVRARPIQATDKYCIYKLIPSKWQKYHATLQ